MLGITVKKKFNNGGLNTSFKMKKVASTPNEVKYMTNARMEVLNI
tara:strand:- start:294 stop:428 length:135 start_codon:yes stop_codon:yes gene_type:complete